jgi:hypothetical protein
MSEGHQWRTDIDDYYEGAVIAAAANKPRQGIGAVDNTIEYIVVCDSQGAWGAGKLLRTFPVTNNAGATVRRALADPTDVREYVDALVKAAYKPVGPKGGVLRQSMQGVLIDGRVNLNAARRRTA